MTYYAIIERGAEIVRTQNTAAESEYLRRRNQHDEMWSQNSTEYSQFKRRGGRTGTRYYFPFFLSGISIKK